MAIGIGIGIPFINKFKKVAFISTWKTDNAGVSENDEIKLP